nr:hypothetical protein BaRGS_018231 [Batillaria attramentaria]
MVGDHFYLMSAGDAMFDFYTQIFDKMRHQEQWRDTSSLTLALQDALQAHHAHDVSRLSVSVEPLPKARERSAVGVTDCIRLNFDVPWPVDVVVNSKCQDLYNQVFQFLLQIKRAKYGLDQLRFADLDKAAILQVSTSGLGLLSQEPEETMSRSERLHRMHTLRFRLAYFVNSLHNYIMTRILHSTGLEFAEEIKKARDLEQVIEVHARYVRTIHERCLLHKKLTFLKEAVTKVLNLTVTFAMRWDQGVDEVSGKTLVDMETEFSRCIQFLASFLNNIIKRGSFPHVERQVFDFLGYMWAPIIGNFFQIIALVGFVVACVTIYTYLEDEDACKYFVNTSTYARPLGPLSTLPISRGCVVEGAGVGMCRGRQSPGPGAESNTGSTHSSTQPYLRLSMNCSDQIQLVEP